MKNFFIKEIKITCCNLDNSSEEAISYLKSGDKNYICVTDAGNIVNAHRHSPCLKNAINSSLISLPDGRPISLLAKLKGVSNIDRVAGPDFMEEIFRRTSGTNVKHYFLGDTVEVLDKLKKKVSEKYDLVIAGSFSPEFGKDDDESDYDMIRRINESGAELIWVSLGGGKQEVWMKNNFQKLNKGLLIGVGAAFRFFTGDIKRAPVFFQKTGFEWFFRLMQQPGKMFGRYLSTLPFFLIYCVQEFFKPNQKDT